MLQRGVSNHKQMIIGLSIKAMKVEEVIKQLVLRHYDAYLMIGKLKHIEIDLYSKENSIESLSKDRLRILKNSARKNKFSISVHVPSRVNMLEVLPSILKCYKKYLIKALEISEKLGAEYLVLHGGYFFGKYSAEERKNNLQKQKKILLELMERNRSKTLKIAIENHHKMGPKLYRLGSKPEDILWLMKELSNLYLVLDASHMDIDQFQQIFRRFKKRVVAVHINPNSKYIGNVFKLLLSESFKGTLIIEKKWKDLQEIKKTIVLLNRKILQRSLGDDEILNLMISFLKKIELPKEKIIHSIGVAGASMYFANISDKKVDKNTLLLTSLLHDIHHSKRVLKISDKYLDFLNNLLRDKKILKIIKKHGISFHGKHDLLEEKILFISDRLVYNKPLDLTERFAFLKTTFENNIPLLEKAEKYTTSLIKTHFPKFNPQQFKKEVNNYIQNAHLS